MLCWSLILQSPWIFYMSRLLFACTLCWCFPVYTVEALLDERKVGRHIEYLGKWKDHDDTHNSWEPKCNILDKKRIEIWKQNKKYRQKQYNFCHFLWLLVVCNIWCFLQPRINNIKWSCVITLNALHHCVAAMLCCLKCKPLNLNQILLQWVYECMMYWHCLSL